MGPALRKGHNRLRIEFEPSSPNASYKGQLSWAYAAGIRVSPVDETKVSFDPGGPEVIVRGASGARFDFGDKSAFEKIKGDDLQMCAGVVLSLAYPPRMAFARAASGSWEFVY